MMKPTKAQAKDRIQRALDEIPALMSMSNSSQEFTKWHRNAEIAIQNTFGENSRHIETFKEIRYSPMSFLIGAPDYQIQAEEKEAYERGLQRTSAILESMIEEIEEYWDDDVQPQTVNVQASVDQPIVSNRVFAVHGRDEAATQTVARYIEGLGLELVILREQPNEGRTIIEKFEEYAQTVGFAVILGTPDDIGALADDRHNLRSRMRQNVVFELGYFTHALGRKQVCVLLKGDVERPSDYDGVIYIAMDDGEGWKLRLATELKTAGLPIDMNRLLSA